MLHVEGDAEVLATTIPGVTTVPCTRDRRELGGRRCLVEAELVEHHHGTGGCGAAVEDVDAVDDTIASGGAQ